MIDFPFLVEKVHLLSTVVLSKFLCSQTFSILPFAEEFQYEFFEWLFLDLLVRCVASLSPSGKDHTICSLGDVPRVVNESVDLIHVEPCLHFLLFNSCIFISDLASDIK